MYNEKTAISQLCDAYTTVGPLEHPFFGVKEQKCLTDYIGGNEALESQFPKLNTFSESVEPLSRHGDPNLTQNEHIYAICCRPEIAGDNIYGANFKIIEGYAVLNLEALSFSSFRENQNQPFYLFTWTVGPLEPHFWGQGAKMSIRLQKSK